MQEHHWRTIRRLVEALEDDPRYQAIIVGGSIAKGRETPSSDVDILLVATDTEFAHRLRHLDLWYRNSAVADYPGGYVDGHVVDRQFLVDVADHGSEPARAAFRGAFVPYARIPDLEALLARIPVYPERERQEKITRSTASSPCSRASWPRARRALTPTCSGGRPRTWCSTAVD